jgi:hypothetical protein
MIEPSPQENKSEVTNPNPEQSGVVLDDKNKENETVKRLKESQIVPEEEKKENENPSPKITEIEKEEKINPHPNPNDNEPKKEQPQKNDEI